MKWVDQQHPHHLGANQNGPISVLTHTYWTRICTLARSPRGRVWKHWYRQWGRIKRLPEAQTAAQSFMDKSGLAQSCVWILSAGREELEVSSRPMSNASHTRTQMTHPSCLSSSQQTSWDVSSPEMALVIRWIDPLKETGLATKTPLPLLSDCTLEVGWGFCKGPQNDLAIPGLSLPYSCDLPWGKYVFRYK